MQPGEENFVFKGNALQRQKGGTRVAKDSSLDLPSMWIGTLWLVLGGKLRFILPELILQVNSAAFESEVGIGLR